MDQQLTTFEELEAQETNRFGRMFAGSKIISLLLAKKEYDLTRDLIPAPSSFPALQSDV